MNSIAIDFEKKTGKIKPMHSVNNGPDIRRITFEVYADAKFPYARTHDSSFHALYGGEHTVDVHAIFPDFSADETLPASYDFAITDVYIKTIIDSGTRVFYRLGSKIEHEIKKYGTKKPADFYKWARICEHIIRHYNEGWADGFYYNIDYWEIWNEPDLTRDDSDNKITWGGTFREFYELYDISASHLKKCFPSLKIGGAGLSLAQEDFLSEWLSYMTWGGKRTPLDFLSWHTYTVYPEELVNKGEYIRKALDSFGYTETESILNEWNYVENWTTKFIKSFEVIKSMKGAAFNAACMLACQKSSIDHLMYYDAAPNQFNGIYDINCGYPLKGYYPFKMFSKLYALENEVECVSDTPCIYACAAEKNGKKAIMLSYYLSKVDDGDTVELEIDVSGLGDNSVFERYALDQAYTMTPISDVVFKDGKTVIHINPSTVLLLVQG